MFINRDIQETIIRYSKFFPVVGVFGPRQSGKTTLVKNIFKDYIYLNFENPETLEFAMQDPKGFLKKYENEPGIIVDEFSIFRNLIHMSKWKLMRKNAPDILYLSVLKII